MARVWAARQSGQRGFQKVVAIKTIMPALAADPEFERMFLDEARIAAAVHHPNVCEILDLGEVGAVLFLAMEWIDGVSLLSLIKARPYVPLPDMIAARLIADACAGLHAAHELRDDRGEIARVVHRDVSPHNILVAQDGTVKVADFGVAKAMGSEHAPTTAGQLKGKVAYMSPEQAVGDTSVDRRSDIFSLGAVLYECVTGRRAWPGANDVQRLQNLLAGNFIHPRQVRPDLPQDLETILARAMAIDPNQRFQTAEQMRLSLEQFLIARNTIVTPTDVSNLVRELCGAAIDEHRARIRHASGTVPDDTSYSGGGNTQVGSTRTPVAITVQGPVTRGMRRTTAMAITFVAGGITLAGLLGIAGVATFPVRKASVNPAGGPQQSAVIPVASAPSKSEAIVIKPKPAEALVEVNGTVIGPGEQKIARPQAGATLTLVVRAQGHEPSTLTIDHDAKAEWEIELTKSAAPAVSSAAPTVSSPPAAAPTPAATTPVATSTAPATKGPSKAGPTKTPSPANTPTKTATPGPKPLPKPGGKAGGIPVNPY